MKTVKISALSAAILLSGFASTGAWAADNETVVIGLAGPLTGPSARIGKDLETARSWPSTISTSSIRPSAAKR
jgi:branched-chain amino acid transport system substrate-binding protein